MEALRLGDAVLTAVPRGGILILRVVGNTDDPSSEAEAHMKKAKSKKPSSLSKEDRLLATVVKLVQTPKAGVVKGHLADSPCN